GKRGQGQCQLLLPYFAGWLAGAESYGIADEQLERRARRSCSVWAAAPPDSQLRGGAGVGRRRRAVGVRAALQQGDTVVQAVERRRAAAPQLAPAEVERPWMFGGGQQRVLRHASLGPVVEAGVRADKVAPDLAPIEHGAEQPAVRPGEAGVA